MADAPDLAARVAQLETEMAELRVMHDLVLRLLSTTRPLARVLEQYGATETQEQALYRLLRTLASVGLFTEVEPGSFALTALGMLLTTAHPMSMRALSRSARVAVCSEWS